MGIVNGRSLSEVLTYSLADSLPLMGIVNKSKQVAVHAVVDSSLPLMGIVNEVGHVPVDPGCKLITPHGDRKRADSPTPGTALVNSLPLMGIVNGIQPSRCNLLYALITPHGDRKRVMGPFLFVSSMNSLPLMGIVNYPLLGNYILDIPK